MSRYKDFREPRRRGGFDDGAAPMPEPRSFRQQRRPDDGPGYAMPSGPEVQATVKWFNPEKGFGFVELADGTGDAFLHARALEAAGHAAVDPGATLSVRVGQGQKGRQVTEVLSVDTSTATPGAGGGGGGGGFRAAGGAPRRSGPRDFDAGPTEEGTGLVKWYSPEKGFGFITPESGGKDVFVHVTALQRSGVSVLAEGQRVQMSIRQGMKGPEARSIEVLD
jgi:CspA family cold shock protein